MTDLNRTPTSHLGGNCMTWGGNTPQVFALCLLSAMLIIYVTDRTLSCTVFP